MKKLLLTLLGALLALPATSAQEIAPSDRKKYTRFAMSYERTGFTANEEAEGWFDGKDSRYLNGFGIALIHGEQLPHKIPLFIEIGLKFHMGFWEATKEFSIKHKYEQTSKMQNLTFTVPLNFNYRLKVSDSFYVAPFVGLNMKINAMLRSKTQYSKQFFSDFPNYDEKEFSKWSHLLSTKDSKGNETTNEDWKVFQFGWQAGIGLNYHNTYVSVSYGTDFVPAFKVNRARINSSTLSITLAFGI